MIRTNIVGEFEMTDNTITFIHKYSMNDEDERTKLNDVKTVGYTIVKPSQPYKFESYNVIVCDVKVLFTEPPMGDDGDGSDAIDFYIKTK